MNQSINQSRRVKRLCCLSIQRFEMDLLITFLSSNDHITTTATTTTATATTTTAIATTAIATAAAANCEHHHHQQQQKTHHCGHQQDTD